MTGVLVGGFVTVVVIALVWANVAPASPQGTQLTLEEAALFGGNPSARSTNTTCQGAAQLELYIQNPAPYPVTIQNITITGSGANSATVLVIVSNSCLTVAESAPSIPAGGDYQLEGYVTAPIAYLGTYRCDIDFSNGQIFNQSLIAQS
jgi:hypothetical protein